MRDSFAVWVCAVRPGMGTPMIIIESGSHGVWAFRSSCCGLRGGRSFKFGGARTGPPRSMCRGVLGAGLSLAIGPGRLVLASRIASPASLAPGAGVSQGSAARNEAVPCGDP